MLNNTWSGSWRYHDRLHTMKGKMIFIVSFMHLYIFRTSVVDDKKVFIMFANMMAPFTDKHKRCSVD